jgi:hypothetical protein
MEEKIRLIIYSEINKMPIRFNMLVTKELAEKYAEVRKENKDMSQMEAYKQARDDFKNRKL